MPADEIMENKKVTIKELLKNRILWRVYLMWFLRRIMPLMALQALIFLAVIEIFAKNVFVSKVFHNAANVADFGYWALLRYSFFAFFNAKPVIQLSVFLILGIVSLLLRDLIRIFNAYSKMWMKR